MEELEVRVSVVLTDESGCYTCCKSQKSYSSEGERGRWGPLEGISGRVKGEGLKKTGNFYIYPLVPSP
jgi:hypothetical protein